jgi:S-formylglutathione hydrolase FrmB
MRSRVATALAVAALSSLVLSSAASGAARTLDTSFTSTAIGARLHFEVYLPADYRTSSRRYPVIYFLHGLPAASTSYTALHFVERALDQAGKPAILVLPQGARPGETDPEYVDHGGGDDWGTAIAVELPRVVDARFRTIPDRAGRALIGVSAGGYGAMHLALKHLGEFSVVESWSGYFHPTNPSGTAPISLGSASRDAAADVHEQLARVKARLAQEPTFIAFYVGRDDSRFAAENRRLDAELTRARIPHLFRIYPGGHEQRLWAAHAPAWLGLLALGHLAAAS